MADLLNHRNNLQTTWTYDNDRHSFTITAVEDINEGEEIYDSYGSKCNHRFLLNYGFVNGNNEEHNEYVMNINLNNNDPYYDLKRSMTKKHVTEKEFKIKMNIDSSVMYEFFAWIRFIEFDGPE